VNEADQREAGNERRKLLPCIKLSSQTSIDRHFAEDEGADRARETLVEFCRDNDLVANAMAVLCGGADEERITEKLTSRVRECELAVREVEE